MIAHLNEEIVVAVALPLVLVATQISRNAYKHIRAYSMTRCVGHISNMIMADEEPVDEEMRGLHLRYPTSVILDATLFISERIYGNRLNRLALIIEVCEIDCYLIERIHRARDLSKVRRLAKLSALTHATTVAESADVYLEAESHEIRFGALTVLVAARPDRAIRHIARFDDRLSPYEVAVLMHLLRRTGAPISYTPLLLSQNRNLQMVGISLCGEFALTDAEPHLQCLAESEDDEVQYMALHAICAIRGDISTSQVGKALKRLVPHRRLSFILHAVRNCYSLRSCAHLLTAEERMLFSQIINSYKCRMVCN